jgi:hypothetical protein
VEGDFDGFGGITGGQEGADLFENRGGELDIVGCSGLFIVEMSMWKQVGAVASRAPFKVNLANEVALHEGLETVVYGGQGNGWHLGADTGVNLVCGGVVALFEKGAVDHLALGGVAQTAVGEALCQGGGLFWRWWAHALKEKQVGKQVSKFLNKWNNSKAQEGIGIILRSYSFQ